MPKKKKSGKLANMTEEERILYLEQQRLAEEEMRKKKEDMLMQFLKDKLSKEERSTKFNLNKLNHQWRNIMREAKAKELKKDIEILSQTFERVVDRKESVIKSLLKDLTEAEEQHAQAVRSHLMHQDKLIALQRQRMIKLKLDFLKEQDELMKEFDSEREKRIVLHTKEVTDLTDISFALEQKFQDKENEAKNEFQSQRDELKNKNLEEKHQLRVTLEHTVEDYWGQFQQALKNYQETTKEREKAFLELKAKDEKSAKEIESQMRKLQRITDQINALKNKMSAVSKENEERNKQLREEKDAMQSHFQSLKGQMNKMRDAQMEELKKLTMESTNAIKELKRKADKGQRILKLSEMCRKLETEEEKVLPFYTTSLTEDEEADVAAAYYEPPSEKLAQAMFEYSSLENFWKRYNKVLLDRLILEKEKDGLSKENQQLKALLKQYLDGISVNDEILSQVNPLFVVNHKTNFNASVPVGDARVKRQGLQTVQEAAHMSKGRLG